MKKFILSTGKSLIGPAIVLLLWTFGAKAIDNRLILPQLGSVLKHFLAPTENVIGLGSLAVNIVISLIRVMLGYIVALLIALPLGIIMGYSKTAYQLANPVIGLFRPIPPIAWVPLVLAWFGITSFATILGLNQGTWYIYLSNFKLSMMFIIFLGTFFPVITSCIHGISQVPNTLIESARVLGAKESNIFFKILIPAAGPTIMNGMRIGLGSAWTSLVSAEMMPGSISGVGYLITHAYELAKIDLVMVGMISIGLIGSLLDFSIRLAGKKRFIWQRETKIDR
ncbi:ABC transporter permease [Lutispora saccharofermentans]|uniref:ABC transporter permease n=1 Tax=Lutispora saccharofermentans TaxID=3024236 RepID=A0ABT1NK01_9FIRM|nr:ABC transporter permease [Lutispora saccharofermentans]MCQ1531521.1 ABC transporter permease [Lutispora saccharofermentans]